MITIYDKKNARIVNGEVKEIQELRGISTDEKPTTGVDNGSTFIEIDTGKIYFFDLSSETWKEF